MEHKATEEGPFLRNDPNRSRYPKQKSDQDLVAVQRTVAEWRTIEQVLRWFSQRRDTETMTDLLTAESLADEIDRTLTEHGWPD